MHSEFASLVLGGIAHAVKFGSLSIDSLFLSQSVFYHGGSSMRLIIAYCRQGFEGSCNVGEQTTTSRFKACCF